MRGRVILGSTLLILGFIIYQLGITMTVTPKSYLSKLAEASIQIFSIHTSEIVTATILYGGGIIAVIGLITAITGIIEREEIKNLQSSINKLEAAIQNIQTSTHQPKTPTPKQTCRFCGANMNIGDSFCPICNKAQT
ncbi:MAG: hypothetical protein ACUVTM_08750 [Candidatus Bathyarchaeia archaeon]